MPDSGFVFPPAFRVVTDGIDAVAGGSIEFYDAGTTTPRTVYSDRGLTSSLGSVVYLDSGGHPVASSGSSTKVIVFVAATGGTGENLLKLVVKDSGGVTLATYDNVQVAQDTSTVGAGGADGAIETIVSKTSDYTIVEADDGTVFNCNPTGGTFTMTLPNGTGLSIGYEVTIRHAGNQTTNPVKIASVAGQAIARGAASSTADALKRGGESVRLTWNGAGWVIVDNINADISEFPIRIAGRISSVPGSPVAGAYYLINSAPTGVLAALGFQVGDLAKSDGAGGWILYRPYNECGWIGYVQDDRLPIQYQDTGWVEWTNVTAPTTSVLGHIGVAHQTSDGTAGGAVGASNNTYYTRTLNTVVKAATGTLSGVTLSGNILYNVPAGTYLAIGTLSFPSGTGSAQARLRGGTAGTIANLPNSILGTPIVFCHPFTLSTSDSIYIDQKVEANAADVSASGVATSTTGQVEVYATFELIDLTSMQGPRGEMGPAGSLSTANDGSAADPGIRFYSAATGFYRDATTGNLRASVGGQFRVDVSNIGTFGFNTGAAAATSANIFQIAEPAGNTANDTRLVISNSAGNRAAITQTNASNHITIAMGAPGVSTLGDRWGLGMSGSGIYALSVEHGGYPSTYHRNVGIHVDATTALHPLTVGVTETPLVTGQMLGLYKAGGCYLTTRNTTSDIEMIFGDNGGNGLLNVVTNQDFTILTNNTEAVRVKNTGMTQFAGRFSSPTLAPGYPSTRYLSGGLLSLNTASTAALQVNLIYLTPFRVLGYTALTRIGFEVTTAVAGNARLGIFSVNSTCDGGTLVLDAGTVSTGTTGIKEITINQTLEPGLYFTALLADNTSTVRSSALTPEAEGIFGVSAPGAGEHLFFKSQTYGAMPSSVTSMGYSAGHGPLQIWLRKV